MAPWATRPVHAPPAFTVDIGLAEVAILTSAAKAKAMAVSRRWDLALALSLPVG